MLHLSVGSSAQGPPPTLRQLAVKLLCLPPSAAAAERNWSAQGLIISKRRNRLAAPRSKKLVYIYQNTRAMCAAEKKRRDTDLTEEKLDRWYGAAMHMSRTCPYPRSRPLSCS